jgi:hypothetical protein
MEKQHLDPVSAVSQYDCCVFASCFLLVLHVKALFQDVI